MAGLAVMADVCRDMVEHGGLSVFCLMTLITVRVDDLIVSARMACVAGCCQVLAGQEESGRRMIE